ncbi:MAG: aminotransferase class V-fold PLP-dependent enzyme, partial [Myroides sp.]
GMRAGTEAPHQVVGMAKALELSYQDLNKDRTKITGLRDYCKAKLQENFADVQFNGNGSTFYNVLNIRLPFSPEKAAMMLFQLDMKGIAVSRGSACQSGSQKPSHVLAEFLDDVEIKKPSLRVSFGHENKQEEIDYLIDVLKGI